MQRLDRADRRCERKVRVELRQPCTECSALGVQCKKSRIGGRVRRSEQLLGRLQGTRHQELIGPVECRLQLPHLHAARVIPRHGTDIGWPIARLPVGRKALRRSQPLHSSAATDQRHGEPAEAHHPRDLCVDSAFAPRPIQFRRREAVYVRQL